MPTAESTNRSPRWAERIAQRYQCSLSPDLIDWLDQEVWRRTGHGEYRDPVDASMLLDDAPEIIWPGLMPCDFLPIISNTAGDWLCVRIDEHNRAAEVVQWYHGGGDWIPWGRSLPEAILFDAIHVDLSGPSRRHAEPAESPRTDSGCGNLDDPLVSWAVDRLPIEIKELLDRKASPDKIAQTCLEHEVAEVAFQCELVQIALHQPMSSRINPKLAQQCGVAWNDMIQWMFDSQSVSAELNQELRSKVGHDFGKSQDWNIAESHCQAASKRSPELAWPWELLGYAAERRGDKDAAIEAYTKANLCSVFTDQSIRLRTHWTHDRAAKFSAARLLELDPDSIAESEYLEILCLDDAQHRRRKATIYWRHQAAEALEQGRFEDAYRCFMSAGWDLGAEPIMAYGQLLSNIAETADQAGQVARAELAETHRRCLSTRYGV